jgi:hypothetical protein
MVRDKVTDVLNLSVQELKTVVSVEPAWLAEIRSQSALVSKSVVCQSMR